MKFIILSLFTSIYIGMAINHHLEERVVKGQNVLSPQQFPWFASMQYIGYYQRPTIDPETNNTVNETNQASATLIHSEYPAAILTAAHCVCSHVPDCMDYDGGYRYGNPSYPWINITYYVTLNNTDITPDGWNKSWWASPLDTSTNSNANPNKLQYIVEKIVTHPNYWHDEPYFYATLNDTAILFLNDSVDGIEAVQLNDDENSAECCSTDDTLTAIGFGAVSRDNHKSQNPDILQYNDNIKLVPTDTCNERISDFLIYVDMNYSDDLPWPYTGLNISDYLESIGIDYEANPDGPWQIIGSDGKTEAGKYADTLICGGSIENGGICFGDSGGPLIKGNDKNGIQVGITSLVWECDDEFDGVYNPPDGWVTLESQYQWIQRTLNDNSYPTIETTDHKDTDGVFGHDIMFVVIVIMLVIIMR